MTRSRRRLWELDCREIGAVLASSFDWRELDNLTQSEGCCGLQTETDCTCTGRPRDLMAYANAHKICHEDGPLAQRIDRILETLHAREIRALIGRTPEQIAALFRPLRTGGDLPLAGLVWAVVSDARPEMKPVRLEFLYRLDMEATRLLVTGGRNAPPLSAGIGASVEAKEGNG